MFVFQGEPIVICDSGDGEMSAHAYKCVTVPHTVDCLQGILAIIPLQLLSFHIAVLLGYDVSLCCSAVCCSSLFVCVDCYCYVLLVIVVCSVACCVFVLLVVCKSLTPLSITYHRRLMFF